MSNELCHCPCCQQGIEAPHEYHLERRTMAMSGIEAADTAGAEALIAMSEAEVDAELRSLGIDPEIAARKGAEAVAGALAEVEANRARNSGYTCRMCGRDTPHQHTPEEVIIFRNGIKRGSALGVTEPVGINGLTEAETSATASVIGIVDKITIRYERAGRCFWHIGCTSQRHAPPMAVGADDAEQRRTVIRCTACGEAGYYPHGSVGEVCCERVPSGVEAKNG